MNIFDSTIMEFVNQFSRLSWTTDTTITLLSRNHLFKGGLLIPILWWGWFRPVKDRSSIRLHIVSTMIASFLAMALSRSLVYLLPFRHRPLNEPGLDFLRPFGLPDTGFFENASSFPSDHAALFYVLSTGMFFISRTAGILAITYTTLFICLPRIYLGFHYPTDIMAGALIGITIAWLCNTNAFSEKVSRPVLNWSAARPELFYPLFFIISYQIADMFDSSRAVVKFLWKTLHALLS